MDTNKHNTGSQSGYIVFCAVLLALVSVFFIQGDVIAADHPQQSHYAASASAVDRSHLNLNTTLQFNAGNTVSRLRHQIGATERSNINFLPLDSNRRSTVNRDTIPHPRDVMFRSLILPGWGQYTNRQAWKIPLVYGLIGGMAYYTYYADNRYRGYKAAFYNSSPDNTDFRFGATPAWIDPNAGPQFYRESRNFFRNRRDFLIIATVLSYGLNVLDAYVFAHMRDFDVSDDLSERRINITPSAYMAGERLPVPTVSFSLRF